MEILASKSSELMPTKTEGVSKSRVTSTSSPRSTGFPSSSTIEFIIVLISVCSSSGLPLLMK
ncbi:unknown [Acidaminococcus sp. CAG:917]|nr:unknown [Acidaminococcus sp. CAG:917]